VGGELPQNITEMLKSALNSIGGRVTFIPYDPAYMENSRITGYSKFENKIVPDVAVSGGITEFDRGLETRGKNLNAGVETEPFTNIPDWFPGETIGMEYGQGQKTSTASITVDFNLIDFQTLSGLSRMQTVNTIKVYKGSNEKELGITMFGPTFGIKGSIKKVQGRHAAIRLLSRLSTIQIVGKYLKLPYWRLLPSALFQG
jgi:curli biogenesis system outer membrane secretion channel CsgG